MKSIYLAVMAAVALSVHAQISDGTSNTIIVTVPEAGSTLALLGIGVVALVGIKRRFQK